MTLYKTFALLNGWNMTKLVLTTHEREWRNHISELKDRDDTPLLLEGKK